MMTENQTPATAGGKNDGISVEEMYGKFELLNNIGSKLSSEQDIKLLLEYVLIAAKSIVNADGGTVYRVKDGREISFEIMMTDSLGISMGGSNGKKILFPAIPLYDENGKPNDTMVVAYSVLHDVTVNIGDAYVEQGFDFSGTRKFDKITGYRSKSFLTVPMKNHEQEIIGVLQLINARDRKTGQTIPFSDIDQHFAESLASQAAVALTNRELIAQLQKLFESFVSVINNAIDKKSAYTWGHCKRVPELTMMLAEALNETDEGPFSDFRMSDRDRFELSMAGLLHDCGKITTPVHVVDKATKLETISDRIHLIETRFEVLKRDARIGYLEACAREPARKHELELQYHIKLQRIEDDLEFLRRANIGSEAMRDDEMERVREIARSHLWTDEKGLRSECLTPNELENLTIRAGTLTAAERNVINDHVSMSISMLESLPWPRHLKNVPEYAGGHHEKMDGTGYPKGLKREQMSIQARIMGIADIFEALTAMDRPYKKQKSLTEALDILGKMALGGHVDPDLFDIFLRKGVYERYAKKFLDPAQLAGVDLTKIPGYTP